MKTFKQFIKEARSNPDLNPKVSAYEYLKPYADDNSVYISFTDIEKLGVNPKSKFSTPIGIYFYPLSVVWEMYDIDHKKSLRGLPFAADRPHIWLVRSKDGDGFVEDMYSDYGSNDYDKDERILEKIYRSYAGVDDYDWESLRSTALSFAKQKNPIMSFWNLTRYMSYILSGLIEIEIVGAYEDIDEIEDDISDQLVHCSGNLKSATMWNKLLRQCGYDGFGDKSGRGFIHPSEPIQTMFLTRQAFDVIGMVHNKDYERKHKQTIRHIEDIVDMWVNGDIGIAQAYHFLNGMYDEHNKNTKFDIKLAPFELINTLTFEDMKNIIKLTLNHITNNPASKHSTGNFLLNFIDNNGVFDKHNDFDFDEQEIALLKVFHNKILDKLH
jgi:hypothetical protein